MSVTASTGYVLAQNGKTVPVTVPGTRIVSSRLRFKGSTIVDSWSNYRTGIGSASFPSPPSGYSLDGGRAEFSITITAGPAGHTGSISVSAPGGSKTEPFSLGPNQSQRVSVWVDCYGYGTATGSIAYGSGSGEAFGASIIARAYASRTRVSTNPKATVGAQNISGPATLADGVESDWYTITAGNLLPGDNQVLVNVEGSLQVWLEVEYTYDPYPPAPTRNTPANLAVVDNRQQPFELTLSGAAGSSATQYHAKITISQSPTLSSPIIIADSSVSQTGWEKWNGAEWVPLTSTGVTAGGKVKYTPPSPLPLGVLYWTATTKDNWGYGLISSIWSLRVVLSVDSQEGYALAVDSVPYKCIDLQIKETSNGEIGLITFVIKNTPNAEGVRPFASIPYGASVAVALYDSIGHERQYLGRVWKKDPGDVYLTITATMGDRILAERLVKQDYLEADIGTSLASIVAAECAPLQNAGIPNPIGIIGSLAVKGRAALEAFQEAFRVWGLLFWTETAITDWVQYLRDPNTLAAQGVLIEYPPAPEEV